MEIWNLKINTYSVFLLYNYKTLLPLPLPPSSALVFDTHGQLRLVQGYCSPTVRSSESPDALLSGIYVTVSRGQQS